MSRRIPQTLYDEVLQLATLIAQPDASPLENVDESVASDAMRRLREIYELLKTSGTPDPAVTEAVADFTDDNAESVRLYQLALNQSTSFPEEPTATKHIGLVHRLREMGRTAEAREHLLRARRAAFVEPDATALAALDELDKQFAV